MFMIFFILVMLGSLVSAYHIFETMSIGNPIIFALAIAVVYEFAQVLIVLLIPQIKDKTKSYVFSVFAIIILIQLFSNIYYSYNFIQSHMDKNAVMFNNFYDILNIFSEITDKKLVTFIFASIIGMPIPIITLLLAKIFSDKNDEDDDVQSTDEYYKKLISELE